jgi:hypothetical protein
MKPSYILPEFAAKALFMLLRTSLKEHCYRDLRLFLLIAEMVDYFIILDCYYW